MKPASLAHDEFTTLIVIRMISAFGLPQGRQRCYSVELKRSTLLPTSVPMLSLVFYAASRRIPEANTMQTSGRVPRMGSSSPPTSDGDEGRPLDDDEAVAQEEASCRARVQEAG